MGDTDTCTTLNNCLKLWAEKHPQREAITFFNRKGRHSVCKPGEFYQMVHCFASRLKKRGFRPGEVIANAIPNSMERLVTDLGLILAGCVPVNCQVVEKDGADFWNMAQISGCVAVILPFRDANPSYRLFKQFLPFDSLPDSGFVNVDLSKAPKLTTIILVDRYGIEKRLIKQIPSLLSDLKENMKEEGKDTFVHMSNPEDLAYIFQTSGSTGYCKLVPRNHTEILLMARSLTTSVDITQDKYFNDRPFGWAGGFPFQFFSACGPLVAQDEFDGIQAQTMVELWNGIAREKCYKALMIPQHVIKLCEEFRNHPPEFKLNLMIISGQPITKVVTESIGLLTKYLILSYASTEAHVATNHFLADKLQFQDYLCGKPFADTSIRVVDERMCDLEPGKQGKILLKSSRILTRYYNQVPLTPIFTSDGWFITGDRGWVSEDGTMFVSDREDNAINHGAVLVFPSWPEGVLSRSPDVQEVVVIGVPDATGGSKLCACVVLKEGSAITKDDLMKFYQSCILDWHREEYIPTLTYVEFVAEIPKTFNSKVDLRRLRRLIFERLSIPVWS